MEDLPHNVQNLIKKIKKNIDKNGSVDSRSWAYFSETNADPKTLFHAFHQIVCYIFESTDKNRVSILKDLHSEVKTSSLLLDAYLYGVYSSNLPGGTDIFTQFVEKDLPDLDWSALKSPYILREPMPGPKGKFNNFICTILFGQSTPEELAESDFVNNSNISFLSNLRKTPLRNFVRAVTIRSAKTGKVLPKFLFEDDKLVNTLLLSQNLQDLQEAMKASFQSDKKYPDYLYATWSSIKDNVRTKMFNYIILPFASYFSQEALQFIINNGLKSLTKSFNFDLFIKTPECLQAANPRLIIEICMNKSDDTSFIASAAEVLNNISAEEFLEVLFTSPITAITATSQIFIQRLKKKNLSEEQISSFVDKFIFENEKVILSLILEALKAGCTDVISESTFLNVSNQIIEFPELSLDIIGLMSVLSDCTSYWTGTETLSLLLDQLLCMKERSNLIQEFFDKFASDINENTIVSCLPMISQVPVVYSRFISICKNRFPEDSQVISEINTINVL